MVDSFDRLRHDTVVGGDNKDGYIRRHSASGSHRCESGVTRGVKEGDLLTVTVDPVSADMLCDTACFRCGDLCISDSVEYRSLAVVDMTHNDNDWISRLEIFFLILAVVNDSVFDRDDDFFLNLCAELCGDYFGCVIIYDLVDRRHNAVGKELLDNLGGCHLKL